MRVVSMLSCPIRSARKAMSLQRSKKLFAKRWRKECGYTTTGSMPYRTASFFNCPEMPLVVILSPYLFKKMKPLSWCLSFSQERASFCRALGMYIRRSLPPFEYKSKCPSLMCSTLICMSSLTRAPVAARKRITKYQNSSLSRLRQVLKYS